MRRLTYSQLLAVIHIMLIAVTPNVFGAATGKDLKPDLTKLRESKYGHILYLRDVTKREHEALLGTSRLTKIYIMTGDGKGQAPFIYPEGLVIVGNPCWAPDGESIVFSSNYQMERSAFFCDAFQVRLKDGRFRRLTGDSGSVEGPGGTGTIVGSVKDGTGREPVGGKTSYVITWKGGKGKCDDPGTGNFKITGVPAGAVWVKAIHSKHIGGLDVVEVQKGKTAKVSVNLALGNYLATNPSITPDGRYIVALFQQAIYREKQTIQLQGDDAMVIFDRKKQGVPVATWETIRMGEGKPSKDPKLSPDGKHIAFAMGHLPIESLAVCSFNSFLRGKPDTQVLVEGQRTFGFDAGGIGNINPAWSPDGRRIAFAQYRANPQGFTGNICVVNADGSNAVQVTQVGPNQCALKPSWAPNGRYIAFQLITSKGRALDLGEISKGNIVSDIWTIRADGTNLRQLTTDGRSGEPAWGP